MRSGLACYLAGDHVHNTLKAECPELTKYKVLPDSGYFVEHNSTRDEPVIAEQFQAIYELSNASVPPACLQNAQAEAAAALSDTNGPHVEAAPSAAAWRCNFAQGAFATMQAPVFVVQSTLDLWQTVRHLLCLLSSAETRTYST